jgi:hypothetical protein
MLFCGDQNMPFSVTLANFWVLSCVFVTLIYLAIQTRNIKKQSQAEARYAFVDAMAEIEDTRF